MRVKEIKKLFYRFNLNRYVKRLAWYKQNKNQLSPENEQCPTCGYYCLGKGGAGCIDKPTLCGYNLQNQSSSI